MVTGMAEIDRRLPNAAWRSIAAWTAVVVAISVILSDGLSIWLLDTFSQGINEIGLIIATVLPIVLGGPMTFYHMLRHRQLRAANAQLDILASTDWLTDCLNRRAFTADASSLLEPGDGALLVIDADHFKSVNDRFGHEAGDDALRELAATIRSAVREHDVVGRIGGEEFGVFLPGADFDTAIHIAQRIREAVAEIAFAPAGGSCSLSVSIGGASVAGHANFGELFRVADQQLYGAKSAGRNRIELVRMPPSIDQPANSNRATGTDQAAAASP